ncbi:MAG: DinB family protein [Bryobacteraceae bacterium]
MKIAEILLLDFDPEIANTRRILERIPENDPQWKPHERSMPIGRLALHAARLPDFCTRILTSEEMDMDREKFPDIRFESTAHLLSELNRAAAEARSHLSASSDEDLGKHWKFIFKGHAVVDAPRMVLYRTMFLNHLVHHRAQLTVYLRLLNIKIPGLYGPSADESFG